MGLWGVAARTSALRLPLSPPLLLHSRLPRPVCCAIASAPGALSYCYPLQRSPVRRVFASSFLGISGRTRGGSSSQEGRAMKGAVKAVLTAEVGLTKPADPVVPEVRISDGLLCGRSLPLLCFPVSCRRSNSLLGDVSRRIDEIYTS